MITNLKTTIWAIALLFSVASVMVLSSCSEDDPPPPDPVIAPGVSYAATTVAVGSTGIVVPAVTGDAATYEITDDGGAADFVAIDVNTGVLSVAQESTTGAYSVVVKATNSAGSSDATAEITIGINEAFDPTGKGYLWQYYMNQDEPWTLSGLDGEIAKLPFPSVDIPTGWPEGWPALDPNVWNELTLLPYLAVGQIADLLMQLPGDIACGNLTPVEHGDTLYFEVEADLSLTTICTLDDKVTSGTSVIIGSSTISWADGEFSWALNLESQIPLTYLLDNATFEENFVDPLEAGAGGPPPRIYPAVRGMVEEFTTPTNVESEATILTSLTTKKVEVILEVIELP